MTGLRISFNTGAPMPAAPSRDRLIADMTRALATVARQTPTFNAYDWGCDIACLVPALVAAAYTNADAEARIAGYLWDLNAKYGIDRLDLHWTAEFLVDHVARDLGLALTP